jgi:demethylmenaquinone methyltransferase / 2-methoxy-6-polyprenyl-1,4-benzoquinol methylase
MSDTVPFGYQDVPEAEKEARVAAVFSSVARKYDVMNDAMSGGMHRLWNIAFRLADRGADVTVADINQDMLDVGLARAAARGIDEGCGSLVWSQQNAEALTLADRSFDAYTIAFGIRNVTHIDRALAEAHRVLRFGGRFFCLEFSNLAWPGVRELYDAYSHRIVPRIGRLIAGDADSYRYLIESIRRFPPAGEFEAMIRRAGFGHTRVEPIVGGLVAIHSGWKV